MASINDAIRNGKASSVATIAGLGMVAIWLFLAGIIGAIKVDGDAELETAGGSGSNGPLVPDDSGLILPDDFGAGDPTTPDTIVAEDGSIQPAPTTPGGSSSPQPGGSNTPVTAAPGSTPAPTTAPGGSNPSPTTTPPATAGDRTGVSNTTIKIGIHAPESIGGAPLNLAEDPIKGVRAYAKFINDNGGIHGRMLEIEIADDRYETSGGADAARRLIENKNFIISGTLGVDQINVVANEAAKAGIPYHAAGGSEGDFGRLGVYQISTSYDTHVVQLARFLASDDTYKGKKVGISALNSGLIKPSVDIFKAEAKRVGVNVVATVFIEKPTDQSSYSAEIQRLKDAGAEVFVPLQDPVSTSRMVSECVTALCGWRYTFSNFAHESDTALTLFAGEWGRQQARGLSASCYYLSQNADNPAHCGHMDRAHAQWVEIYDQADWEKDGQGGATGYQIISMLAEALRRSGPDLTRQRYTAAIRTYDNFDDLISSPITFRGKSTFAHGSDKMVVYEAQANDKYKQLTPGFVQF